MQLRRLIDRIRASAKQSPLHTRYLGAAAWSVVGAVVSSGTTLVSMIVVARMLGKEAYGQLAVLQSTLGMVGIFAGLGLGATATRYVAALRDQERERLPTTLGFIQASALLISVAISTAIVLLSPLLSRQLFDSSLLAVPLALAAGSVIFLTLDGCNRGVLLGLEAMRSFAATTAASALIGAPIVIILGLVYGLNGVALAVTINSLIQFGISRWAMMSQLHRSHISEPTLRHCLKEWIVFRNFGLPSFLAGMLYPAVYWASNVMLVRQPHGFSEMAILGVAMQWYNAVMFLPNYSGRVILPILSNSCAQGRKTDIATILRISFRSNLISTAPIALSVAIASPVIMNLYGPDFRDGWPALAASCIVSLIVVSVAPLGSFLAATNRMWVALAMNVGWSIAFVVSCILMVRFGALGISISLAVAYATQGLWSLVYVRSILQGSSPAFAEGQQ